MSLIDQALGEGYPAPHWAPEYWPAKVAVDSASLKDNEGWSPWIAVRSSASRFNVEAYDIQFTDPAGNFQVAGPNDPPDSTPRLATAYRSRPKAIPVKDQPRPVFKTKQHGEVSVTTSSGQQWLKLDTCPRGSKVQLMFRFGLPRYEVYHGQPDAVAWAPMPDSPAWLKDELSNQHRS